MYLVGRSITKYKNGMGLDICYSIVVYCSQKNPHLHLSHSQVWNGVVVISHMIFRNDYSLYSLLIKLFLATESNIFLQTQYHFCIIEHSLSSITTL
jgi:hypothetical protein